LRKSLNTEEFIKRFNATQPENSKTITILGEYVNIKKHILVMTKYGECRVVAEGLLLGHYPSIISSVDKTKLNKYQAVLIEKYLHEMHSEYKYEPNIKFSGFKECFTEVEWDTVKYVRDNIDIIVDTMVALYKK